jgi:predicted enzyme related to lactoylglutathione lyase
MPVDETTSYSMAALGRTPVAAISPQPRQQRDNGVPPLWSSYITVDDADATVERARALGATVHAPAFDVMQAGRMAVIQDPQGAYVLAWQPRDHIGAGLVNAPGALVWNELGGAVLGEPTDIGIARIAIVTDPQGAVFALYDGNLDD